MSSEEINRVLREAGYTPVADMPGYGKGKRKPRPEDAMHLTVAKFLRRAVGSEGRNNAGVFWETVGAENKGGKKITLANGRTMSLDGQRAKAKGVKKGSPDIHLMIHGRGARIELKAGKNRLTDEQRKYANEFIAAGGLWACCYSLEEVQQTLLGWGVSLTARVMA